MIKAFFTVILLLFMVPIDLSFAQVAPEGSKIYSGYLHQYDAKNKASFWHALFGAKSPKKEDVVLDSQCSVEFQGPISSSHQPVAVMPEELTYLIRFKNGPQFSQADSIKEKDAFEKFSIKIYTNDDEEYSIDPDAEGKQVGINDEHHIFDSYLIYLILGSDINHLEIVSSSDDDQDKYVLDKLEVHDNH
jgi:hypothetical protein